jgi:hypothetical protein
LTSQCATAAERLKGVNDELQRDKASITRRLADYKRLHPNACITVSESAKPTTGGRGYVGAHELLDYAAECEEYRKQRIVLEGLLQ